ncbi:hypothetical protein BSY238_853 [Methyloversatilis sp. RAC08]|nr:hypothetical protein BSY238_853 [Methyloversatilis sp. RAC08]
MPRPSCHAWCDGARSGLGTGVLSVVKDPSSGSYGGFAREAVESRCTATPTPCG